MSLRPVPDGPLRSGYTTGACATACTKAALLALLGQQPVREVSITLPGGEDVPFTITQCTYNQQEACCATLKDAGDDPDVTHGAEISVTIALTDAGEVLFLPGAGVGTVTLPGLAIAVGEPAINPVPRQMMRAVVAEVLAEFGEASGVAIRVAVAGGEQLALKTLNGRLGIMGGISILGTTGIVKPFSAEAYVASIVQGIDVALANGLTEVVINSGGRSEKLLRRLFPHLPALGFIQYGNWIGETLDKLTTTSLASFTMGIMLGKAVKLAQGALNTHSQQSSWDRDWVTGLACTAGYSAAQCAAIAQLTMAGNLTEVFPFVPGEPFYAELARRCAAVVHAATGGAPPCRLVLIDAAENYLVFDF
ncbi:MAG: cobalt-precorrin-5B (C(1))-methyltransferase [Cytophagaceae bacterium]|nr:MAG: cobalt-precorrin-5B (C(1))-methyltransferase [Cytophagaceae bacterium]